MQDISKKIKLVISDFDGIFTDGSILINEDGKTAKRLHFLDIMGVSNLKKANIKFALVSGENSAAMEFLKNKFGLDEVHGGIRIKAPLVAELMKKYNAAPEETAYIGDDINDIEALMLVKNRFTVPGAHKRVKETENIFITSFPGGNGAFREISDKVLELYL